MRGKKGTKQPKPIKTCRTNGSARDKVWKTIRILRCFNAMEVARISGVSLSNARMFIHLLSCHNYVVRHGINRSGRAGTYQTYVLAKNTGPKRPITCDQCKGSLASTICG